MMLLVNLIFIKQLQTINRFLQTGLAGDHPKSEGTKKKTISTGETFSLISHQGGRDSFQPTRFAERPGTVYGTRGTTKPPRNVTDARGGWSKYRHFVLHKTYL